MLTPEEAWKRIEGRLERRSPRRLPRPLAVGRTLAEDLAATVDVPAADVSAMDGYACAGEMPLGRAVEVVGTVAAGAPPAFELAPGTAAKIMTGGVVPAGADRVVPVEKTVPPEETGDPGSSGSGRVVFVAGEEAGAHIRRGGEVCRRGDTLLSAGALLTPGAISLAASHGYLELAVAAPPEVAVIVTGDEVVPPEDEPGPGQLRDSNSAFLLAAGRSLGLEFRYLGIAPDRPEALREKIAGGLESEVLLLSGGVSMGEFDLVEEVLAEFGCERLFDRVAIQPGKPLVASRHEGGWVFGLPGNPASVMVTFWLFVRPLLRRLSGLDDRFWHGALAAELTGPLPASKGKDRFFPARVGFEGGSLQATPLLPRGSHDVVAFARGSALVRTRPDSGPTAAGERCELLPLVDWLDPA
jgi:molybdopterin molybdotransferase